MGSVIIENLTWIEAEKVFQTHKIALVALGARTKEHGPHLPLNNDYIMAEYLKTRVMAETSVIVYPTFQYGFYPAFTTYSGSISINDDTFRDFIVNFCKSLSNHGLKKVYILNTRISTLHPIREAAEILATQHKMKLSYLNLLEFDKKLPPDLFSREGGTHADESETSMMLYIAPHLVNMNKAVKDFDNRPNRRGFSRIPTETGVFSPTGIWGDPTLATEAKGKIVVEALIQDIVQHIHHLKTFEEK